MRAGPLLFLAAAAVAACGTEPGPAGWEAGAGGGGGLLGGGPDLAALAATTDFHSGSWAIAGLERPWDLMPDLGPADADVIARCFPGAPILLGRGTDSLTVLDAPGRQVVAQLALGAGVNPQDAVAVDGRTLAVSLLNGGQVLFIDWPTYTATDGIDLRIFADADGEPEAAPLLVHRGRLLIGLQRLDRTTPRWDPSGPGLVVIVDAAARRVVGAIPLVGANPSTLVAHPDGERVVVAVAGRLLDATDGGLEVIDPVRGESLGLAVGGRALGGDPLQLARDPRTGSLLVTVYTPTVGTAVRRVTLTDDGPLVETLLEVDDYRLTDARYDDRGDIWIADRALDHAGLRVFDGATGHELTAGPLGTGLPPFSLCFVTAPEDP